MASSPSHAPARPGRRAAVVALTASLALAAPLLAGCSLIPHLPGTGGTSGGGGISLPGLSAGTGKLPKDFPTSDVPVISGTVVSGASIGNDKGHIWNATIKVSGAGAADEISSELTGAGFQGGQFASTDQGTTATFQKDKYDVLVVVADDKSNGWIANYTVTYDPTSSSSGN